MRKLFFVLLLPCVLWAKERAVSLSPAVTELIIAAGGKSHLCGRSSACDTPEVKDIPIAGDLGRPFAEKVLSLKATIIITDTEHPQARWELLKKCGVKLEVLSNRKTDDLPENIRKIGRVLNLPEAEEKARNTAKKINELRKNPPAVRKKAVILFSVAPLISCGKDTFIAEALALAGAENCLSHESKSYFMLSVEELFRTDPEIIFTAGIPETIVRRYFANGALQKLSAVKNGKIIILDADKFCRLTPKIIDAVFELRAKLADK